MDEIEEASTHAPLQSEDTPKGEAERFARPRVRLGAVVAVAAAAAFIAWAALGSRGGDSSSTATTDAERTGPVALSASGLTTLVGALNQPIYWLGPTPNNLYELTQEGDGTVYVRYLPSGVDAGDRRPFRTIGTYPMADAYRITEATSKGAGSVPIRVGGGAVAFYGTNSATSAYIAFPDSDYQIEVFDPTQGVAKELVESGRVTTVRGAPTSAAAKAVSPADLKRAAARLGQPIYWAGPEPGETYELSRTASGRVFVRYLPKGVHVGDPKPFRTIATYPLTGAFEATRSLAENANMAMIQLRDGGIAVFDKTARTNVYVAFPGSDYQIEVFDPIPGTSRSLVRSGRIVSVG